MHSTKNSKERTGPARCSPGGDYVGLEPTATPRGSGKNTAEQKCGCCEQSLALQQMGNTFVLIDSMSVLFPSLCASTEPSLIDTGYNGIYPTTVVAFYTASPSSEHFRVPYTPNAASYPLPAPIRRQFKTKPLRNPTPTTDTQYK